MLALALAIPALLLLVQESIGTIARQNKNLKKSSRERYKLAMALLERLRRIEEDVSFTPDPFFCIMQISPCPPKKG